MQVSRTRLQLRRNYASSACEARRVPVSATCSSARGRAVVWLLSFSVPVLLEAGADQGERQELVRRSSLISPSGGTMVSIRQRSKPCSPHQASMGFRTHARSALQSDGVDFTLQARGLGGEDAIQNLVQLAPAPSRPLKAAASSVVHHETLMRPHAGGRQLIAYLVSCVPLVVNGQLIQCRNRCARPARAPATSRSCGPAARARQAQLAHAEVDEGAAEAAPAPPASEPRIWGGKVRVLRHAIGRSEGRKRSVTDTRR